MSCDCDMRYFIIMYSKIWNWFFPILSICIFFVSVFFKYSPLIIYSVHWVEKIFLISFFNFFYMPFRFKTQVIMYLHNILSLVAISYVYLPTVPFKISSTIHLNKLFYLRYSMFRSVPLAFFMIMEFSKPSFLIMYPINLNSFNLKNKCHYPNFFVSSLFTSRFVVIESNPCCLMSCLSFYT